MEFWAQRHEDGLHPLYNSDDEQLKKIRLHTDYKFIVTKPRNIKFHGKYFSMINMVFENQEQYNNIDDLRYELTKAAGYYYMVPDLNGVDQKKAKSISFASMDDIEFGDYYKAIWDVVAKWLDISDEQIRENLVNFL